MVTPGRVFHSQATPATPMFQTPLRKVEPETYNEEFQEYSLLVDFKHILKRLPQGMYVSPSASTNLWNGVVFLHQGPYAGAVFKVRESGQRSFFFFFFVFVFFYKPFSKQFGVGLKSYPLERPTITFETRVYHPLVDPITGEYRYYRSSSFQFATYFS
jgi:hypothetical protein